MEGSWNINGYIFKGLRSPEQLNNIITLQSKYKTKFQQQNFKDKE